MADITVLSRIFNGAIRNVSIADETLVTQSIKVGGGTTNTELTKTLLDRLVSLQNGTDVGPTYHTHDSLYFRESELQSTTIGASGAMLIGVSGTPTNYAPLSAHVQAHLEAIDGALNSAGNEKLDTVFRIVDDGDPSRKIAFQAGFISPATTRTISMPDANVDLADVNNAVLIDGTRTFTANQSMGGFKLTNVAAATNPQDAVNKAQLESYIAGLDFQKDVNDYVDASVSAPDGTSLPLPTTGDRYILFAGTATLDPAWGTISGVEDNDIVEYDGTQWYVAYDVSVQGEGVLVWDRANDHYKRYDGTSWDQFGGLSGVTAGAGLEKSGNVLYIDLFADGGLEFNTPGDAGQLRVKTDESTIERSAAGIRVKDAGISTAKLQDSSVTTDKIADSAVTTPKINDEAVTTAKLAPISVTAQKINNSVYDQKTITGGAGVAATVIEAPRLSISRTLNQSIPADETRAVRFAVDALGETLGTLMRAGTSDQTCFAIGLVTAGPSGISSGSLVDVVTYGLITVGVGSEFGPSEVGMPVYVTSTGGLITDASGFNPGQAITRIGIVVSVSQVFVQPHFVGIN